MHDHRGAPLTGADSSVLAILETAVAESNLYNGDPVATLDDALAQRPDFAMALALKAYLLLSGMEQDLVPEATDLAARLRALPLNARERAHAGAVQALALGEFHEASRRLDEILVDDPRDIVALQVGHLLDSYRGDSRNFRDRVGRVVDDWEECLSRRSGVAGAFGETSRGRPPFAAAVGGNVAMVRLRF